MRPSKRICLAPLLASVLLLACSSSDKPANSGEPATDAGATPITAQSACEHEFRVRFERCLKDVIAPATMTSAGTRYVASCVSALALGGSTRTADEIDACAKAVEAEECGAVPELLPACAAKAGTLATGSSCNVDAQCQTGRCDVLSTQAKEGCGVCADVAAEGEPCTAERGCAINTFCVGSPSSPRVGSCKRVQYVDTNAPCNGFDIQCRVGSICVSMDGAAHTCQPAFTTGKPCTEDGACAKGTYCSQTTATCTNHGGVDDACDSQKPCKDGLGCDRTTNKCAPLTFAEPGESCGGSIACREGVCGQGTGAPTCAPIVEDGKGCLEGAHMTCRAPAACVAGACVMPTTSTCQ